MLSQKEEDGLPRLRYTLDHEALERLQAERLGRTEDHIALSRMSPRQRKLAEALDIATALAG